MRWKFWLEYALLLLAVLLIALAGLFYYRTFGTAPVGNQEQWARFGDYFGGVSNPLIGLVTVVLVVLTLRTTRQEADMTRRQMTDQIDLLKRQEVLRDMQKRLEGALEEWNRELSQPAHWSLQHRPLHELTIPERDRKVLSVREILEDREILHNQLQSKRMHDAVASQNRYVAPNWKTAFAHLMPLLSEIDTYCVEYEQLAGTRGLANYYRARVKSAVEALGVAGIMADSVHDRLTDIR